MRNFLPLSLLLLLASAAPGTAQVNRAVWIVEAGYVESAVVATGFRWIFTPAPVERVDPVSGMTLPVTSRTSLHASGSGGISVAGGRDRTVDWTALASLGFVRPIGVGPISGIGLLAMGSLQPDAAGPGVRVESGFRALGLNAGVLFADGATHAAAVLDISGVFLRDIFR
jgi:hypothetical protein